MNKLKRDFSVWSLYYRQEIVWFIVGFILGALTMLFMGLVISCTMTPLEAGLVGQGSSPYDPIYVKIVD